MDLMHPRPQHDKLGTTARQQKACSHPMRQVTVRFGTAVMRRTNIPCAWQRLVGCTADAFFQRVGRQAVLRTGILPGVTYCVKRVCAIRKLDAFAKRLEQNHRILRVHLRFLIVYYQLDSVCQRLPANDFVNVFQARKPPFLQFAGEALRVNGVPSVVLAPAIGTIVGAVRGLLPWA